MSLKSFHVVFIIVATLLSILCACKGWLAYAAYPESAALAFASGFSILAVAMIFYGIWFVKKSRKIIV